MLQWSPPNNTEAVDTAVESHNNNTEAVDAAVRSPTTTATTLSRLMQPWSQQTTATTTSTSRSNHSSTLRGSLYPRA